MGADSMSIKIALREACILY